MNKKLFFCIFFATWINATFAQNTTILFLSKENTSVIVFKPLDDNYNEYYPTDTIQLIANKSYTYHFSINNWAVVKCIFPKKMPVDLYVEKGDKINVTSSSENILFEGRNAKANDFSYKNIVFIKSIIKSKIDSIFKTKDFKYIEKIINNPKSLIQSTGFSDKLDSMLKSEEIDSNCYNYFSKEMDFFTKSRLLNKFRDDIKKGHLMNDTIKTYVDNITKGLFHDQNITSYVCGSYFSELYCSYLYNQLNDKAKTNLIANYDLDTFGLYLHYLLANDKTQLSLFFDAFVVQYKYGFNEFNHKKMFSYLNNKFSQSESVKILGHYMAEELSDTAPVKPIFINSTEVKTFSDIKKTDHLQNKYILLDIWASWCMPCRAEFTNNKALNALLARYKNIEKLYISIDESKDNWKKAIQELRLSGNHLLASSSLLDFLKRKIYNSNTITVPRYVLIDPNGEILNNNLPKPSSINTLKIELDKNLK